MPRPLSSRIAPLPPLFVAILLMIASMAWFSLMNIFIRYASHELHTTQIVFLRNLFSMVLLLPWVLRHGSQILVTDRIKGHFWRATVGIVGMQLWFFSVASLPLNEATALSFTAPIFTTLFAVLFLKEKAGLHRWGAVLLGFVGAMIIIRPNPHTLDPMMFVVLIATSFWAIAGMLVKSLTATEPANRIVFYMATIMTLWSLPLAIMNWQTPSMTMLLLTFGVAVASTGAHICLVQSYARADVVLLMPFDFFRLVFTAIFAYIAFGEVADRWTWMGGAIIVASAAYIAHREARKKRKHEPKLTDNAHVTG